MSATTNPYCEILQMAVPSVELAKKSRDAGSYSLLIAYLLERGAPVTLNEAAQRFEEAGVAPAAEALASLKRCRPGRPPIYRDGDHYALDPHDHEASLWAFRLGLRPPKAARLQEVRPEPPPLPPDDTPLTLAHLEEVWRDGIFGQVSAQRLALAVLDAHGEAMKPDDVVGFFARRGWKAFVSVDSANHWRRGAPIRVREDGFWVIEPGHKAIQSMRTSIYKQIRSQRRWDKLRGHPEEQRARSKAFEREREKHGDMLAHMQRVLLYAFPAKQPEALVLVDVNQRQVATYMGAEIQHAVERIKAYDIIAAVNVRNLLATLAIDPGLRPLAELAPPQKTMTVDDYGRTIKITNTLLIQSSCGIRRPFGDEKQMQDWLTKKQYTKLQPRLEADAKSLLALYQYGRLQGFARVLVGPLDDLIVAPWVHSDEVRLYGLMRQACDRGVPLEVVVGTAPDWDDPWSRMQMAFVEREADGWTTLLVDPHGRLIDERDVQMARLPAYAQALH